MSGPLVDCPRCGGSGTQWTGRTPASGDPGDVEHGPDCTRCSAAGQVPAWSIVHYAPLPLQGAPTWKRISHCETEVCIGADGVRANEDGEVYSATSSNMAHVECKTCLALARPAKRREVAGLGSYAEQMRDAGRGHLLRGDER